MIAIEQDIVHNLGSVLDCFMVAASPICHVITHITKDRPKDSLKSASKQNNSC